MNIKLHSTFKGIEGLSKGKEFIIIEVGSEAVTYKSVETGRTYTEPRKHFEKYLQRVNKYWSETNKSYKVKKSNLKSQDKY